MKKKIVLSSIATVAVLSLVGCGGGSSDTTVATGKSFYLDSAVSGINYKCGTQEGITDAEGAFTFDVGSSCTFYLGDIQLRDIAADVLKDGESIVEDDAKIAQLLQTLDEDGDPTNGITVSPEVVDAMSTALNANGANGTLPDTEEELNALSAELETEVPDYEGHAVTEAEAEEHLATTQASVDAKKLKTFFAGKTLYNINEQDSIEAVIFNNDATTIQFGTEQAVDITFGAHEIVDKDGEHFIDEITDTYVKGHDSYGEFIFYVTEADAQAALDSQGNQGRSNDLSAESLKAYFAGRTLYEVYNGEISEMIFNADATTLQVGTHDAPWAITISDGKITDKDGDHFVDEIIDTYVKGHDSQGNFTLYVLRADAQAALDAQGNGNNSSTSSLESLIVGKTYYVTVEDSYTDANGTVINNNHVETLIFGTDGKIHDTWTENGQQQEKVLDYTIGNGILSISGSNGEIALSNIAQSSNYISFTDPTQETGRFFFTYEDALAALQ